MMEKEILKEPQFTDEIVSIIRSGLSDEEIVEKLHDYHDNDIAAHKICKYLLLRDHPAQP